MGQRSAHNNEVCSYSGRLKAPVLPPPSLLLHYRSTVHPPLPPFLFLHDAHYDLKCNPCRDTLDPIYASWEGARGARKRKGNKLFFSYDLTSHAILAHMHVAVSVTATQGANHMQLYIYALDCWGRVEGGLLQPPGSRS